jgi:hypothetical protein
MVDFLKKHWTWIATVAAAVWTAVAPSAVQATSAFVSAHPVAGVVAAGAATFLAAVSPSPLSK